MPASIFSGFIYGTRDDDTIRELVKLYRAGLEGADISDGTAFSRLTEKLKAAGFTKGHYYRGV